MNLSKKFYLATAFTFLFLPFIGCDGGGGGAEPEAPMLGELEQFLADNPDIAAETEEEQGDEG